MATATYKALLPFQFMLALWLSVPGDTFVRQVFLISLLFAYFHYIILCRIICVTKPYKPFLAMSQSVAFWRLSKFALLHCKGCKSVCSQRETAFFLKKFLPSPPKSIVIYAFYSLLELHYYYTFHFIFLKKKIHPTGMPSCNLAMLLCIISAAFS